MTMPHSNHYIFKVKSSPINLLFSILDLLPMSAILFLLFCFEPSAVYNHPDSERRNLQGVTALLHGQTKPWSHQRIQELKQFIERTDQKSPKILGWITDAESKVLSYMHATPKWYRPIVVNILSDGQKEGYVVAHRARSRTS